MPSDAAVMRGIVLAKQYPNREEPVRGLFVRSQVMATADRVSWEVVVPVPWLPRWAVPLLRRPHVSGSITDEGIPVTWAPYPVLPRRMLYGTVGGVAARSARRAFRDAAGRLDPQFVHAHALYPSGAAALRLARQHELPLVVTVHGSDLYTNLGVPSWRREIEAVVSGAARVICVSSTLADDVKAEFPDGSGRVLVIPDTFDTETFFHYDRDHDRASRPDGPLRLIAVGRLSPEKGFDVLIEALAILTERGIDAELTLIGSGGERSRLEEQIARHGLGERVDLLGNVASGVLGAAYCDADLFVLPSRREGFGVALIEALATGLPAVATRSGGPADIVGSGDGQLVESDDPQALATGIERTAARLESFDGRAIAERALQRFGPQAVGARLVDVYADVIGEADHRG